MSIKKISGLKERVKYSAHDSIRLDIPRKLVFLYGKAKIEYEDLVVESDTIMVNFQTREIKAGSRRDSAGNLKQRPTYKDKESEFDADWMAYNFDTRKGKVGGLTTHEGDIQVYGRSVKKDPQNNAYVSDAQMTTCIDPHPHFYISAKKLKIIPGKQVVTGPANLVVSDVPTPAFLPFGFFPISRGQKRGILFPSYGESSNRGFFISGLGYYFPLTEHMDLALTGDFYFRGSYAVYARSNYAKRYRYNGNFGISYAYNQFGTRGESDYYVSPDFRINWNHAQDAKRRPNTSFGASVNIATSNFLLNNSQNPNDIVKNTLNSSINWGKVFGRGRYNLNAGLRHDQNTTTRDISFSLPTLSFGVMRVTPFQRKQSAGTPKWYEDLGFSYQMNARNDITTKDSLLFRKETLDQFRNGISHNIPLSASVRVLKYFTFSPSFNYSEFWYFKTTQKQWDDVNDTLLTGQVDGFKRGYNYNTSLALSTRLFGKASFKRGRIAAIRHAVTPTLSATFSPDFSDPKYGFYHTVQTDTPAVFQKYSIFENGILGGPGQGRSGTLGLTLNNNLEMKTRKGTDSGVVVKKVKLIEQFALSGGYNFFADAFKVNVVTLSGYTTLFEKLNLNFGASLDPYSLDTAGKRVEKFYWSQKGKLARFTDGSLSFSTSLNKDAIKRKKSSLATPEEQRTIDNYRSAYVDFEVPWNLSINYNISYQKPGQKATISQTVSFFGDFNLTPKWKIGFTSGYDFTNKGWAFTSIDFYRDLHCWELKLNWIPVGIRKSFLFTINVKSSALQDLKLNKRGNWYDQL